MPKRKKNRSCIHKCSSQPLPTSSIPHNNSKSKLRIKRKQSDIILYFPNTNADTDKQHLDDHERELEFSNQNKTSSQPITIEKENTTNQTKVRQYKRKNSKALKNTSFSITTESCKSTWDELFPTTTSSLSEEEEEELSSQPELFEPLYDSAYDQREKDRKENEELLRDTIPIKKIRRRKVRRYNPTMKQSIVCEDCGTINEAKEPINGTDECPQCFRIKKEGVPFRVSKHSDKIVAEQADGNKILMFESTDALMDSKKIKGVLHVVNKDLGWVDDVEMERKNEKLFIYITNHGKAVGALLAHKIRNAYKVVNEEKECNNSNISQNIKENTIIYDDTKELNDDDNDGVFVDVLSTNITEISNSVEVKHTSIDNVVHYDKVSVPASCGISRIWVVPDWRRQRVAWRLMEALRQNFFYGSCLDKSRCAFSQPTTDGKNFASRYFGTKNFLVFV